MAIKSIINKMKNDMMKFVITSKKANLNLVEYVRK